MPVLKHLMIISDNFNDYCWQYDALKRCVFKSFLKVCKLVDYLM